MKVMITIFGHQRTSTFVVSRSHMRNTEHCDGLRRLDMIVGTR